MSANTIELPWDAIIACPTPLARAFDALDARLATMAMEVRARGAATLDELRGIAVGHDRIESLLQDGRRSYSTAIFDVDAPPLSDMLLLHPAWRELARHHAPQAVERDLVLLALSREMYDQYGTIFGYLNDDLTRPWPSRALVLQLLARDDDERAVLRDAMGEASPLVSAGILRLIEPSPHSSWASSGVGLTALAAALLGDSQSPERHLPESVAAEFPSRDTPMTTTRDESRDAQLDELVRITERDDASTLPLIVVEGRRGSGRTRLARDLARLRGCPLLRVTASRARDNATVSSHSHAVHVDHSIRAAVLFQQLHDAVIVVDGIDGLCEAEQPAHARDQLPAMLARPFGPILCRVERGTRWHSLFQGQRTALLTMPDADHDCRAKAWRVALEDCALVPGVSAEVAALLADRFDLTTGEIVRVVRQVADEGALCRLTLTSDTAEAALETPAEITARAAEVLSAAARSRTRDAIGALAVHAPTPHTWEDLILPAPTMMRLREFAMAVRDRPIVLDKWQFGRRIASSRGATALFSGASGTGKTMGCSIIARELGLDLFVIDLSSVVSKYIGETEKNLDRVFRAARDAGAVLFFDEADALFGKRSEVKDAHDRYANIESAYLLQKLDAHDGIVVLATNLSRNLDAAFSRRMRYVVEFPLPGEADRLRLWRGVIPKAAPLGDDVDLPFLATGFAIAGGDIRNVALDAAYLAASEGRGLTPIGMRHLIWAMARQCVKQGVTPSVAQFRQYAGMLPRHV